MSVELKSIPLVVQPSNRGISTDTDAKLLNAVVERQPDGSVHVFRRPAFRYVRTLNYPGGTGQTVVGYLQTNFLYLSFAAVHSASPYGTRLYSLSEGVGPVDNGALPVAFPTRWEMVWVPTASPKLFLAAKGLGVVFDTGTNTLTSVSPYPPSASGDRIGPMVYLDGIVFQLTADGKIWNSNFNDPSTWASLNFISANVDNDRPMAIQKQLTYIIAFKFQSIEVFYNAAKPQASPLARNESAKNTAVGLLDERTLVRINDTLIWLSNSTSGKLSVHMMEHLRVTEIASPNISRLLRSLKYADVVRAIGFHSGGHEYYLLYISPAAGEPLTLCYDLTSQAWSEWNGPVLSTAQLAFTDSYAEDVRTLLFSENSADVYTANSESYSDLPNTGAPATIPVDIYTPLWDQQVRLKKHNVKLEVHGDQNSAGTVQVRTTDNDYKDWGPVRDMSLADGVATSPNWGTFRRRGWHISNNENVPFRVTNLIAHISLGTT